MSLNKFAEEFFVIKVLKFLPGLNNCDNNRTELKTSPDLMFMPFYKLL